MTIHFGVTLGSAYSKSSEFVLRISWALKFCSRVFRLASEISRSIMVTSSHRKCRGLLETWLRLGQALQKSGTCARCRISMGSIRFGVFGGLPVEGFTRSSNKGLLRPVSGYDRVVPGLDLTSNKLPATSYQPPTLASEQPWFQLNDWAVTSRRVDNRFWVTIIQEPHRGQIRWSKVNFVITIWRM